MSLVFEQSEGAPQANGFLALGDSYTIGEGVVADDRWPNRLAHLFAAAGRDIGEPTLVARTGWTTDELDSAIDAAIEAGTIREPYALVSLLIGVNNQYRGRDTASYEIGFDALLQRAIRFANGEVARVFVVSIPDWGVTSFGQSDARGSARIGAQIDDFNAVAARRCRSAGVAFIDITGISRNHPDLVVSDGLHPDARQYRAWAERIHAALHDPRPT